MILADPDHSTEEDRFLLLGLSSALRVLVVVHCCRDDEAVLRLVSARRATRSERAIRYFQDLAAKLYVPYQTLINLYLRDCAETGRRPAMRWRPSGKGAA